MRIVIKSVKILRVPKYFLTRLQSLGFVRRGMSAVWENPKPSHPASSATSEEVEILATGKIEHRFYGEDIIKIKNTVYSCPTYNTFRRWVDLAYTNQSD